MTRRWRTVVGAALCGASLVGACSGGQSGGEVTTNEPPPAQGSEGQRECNVDEDCRYMAENRLALFTTPRDAIRLTDSKCEVLGVILGEGSAFTGHTCTCRGVDRSFQLGPTGLGCYVVGRTGNCLFDDSEFTTCNVDDRDSCDAICAEVELRVNADAARSVDAELVDYACLGYYCRTVLSLDGRCFVDNEYEYLNRSHDCALESRAILEQRASCGSCPQYDQCLARAISCNARGLIQEPGCGCP